MSEMNRVRFIFHLNRAIFFFAVCFCTAITTGWCFEWVRPVKNPSRVVVIYVDGLRPDTLDEMVRGGRLPAIRKMFYEEGLQIKNFFTIFPSNTIIANGVLLTGKWPSETGLKTQSYFKRYATRPQSAFKRFFRIKQTYPIQSNLLTNTDVGPRILKQNKVRALYNYLGEGYHASVVPISPYTAPSAWPHIAANYVDNPLKITEEAPEKLDDINGLYAVQYMSTDSRGRLYFIWFPGIDEDQHQDPWGQFGPMRNRIDRLDTWIDRIHTAFQKHFPKDKLYFVLLSDHGAYGGSGGVYNYPFHIGRDFFYEQMKMNVLGPDFTIHHPGTDFNSFVYVDNMGRGQCRLYFPVGDSTSGDWSRPNTLYELENYSLGPNRQTVNLLDEILDIDLSDKKHFPDQVNPHPVEFAIVKLSHHQFFVRKQGGAQALIEIEGPDSNEKFRYTPVRHLHGVRDGRFVFEEDWSRDPFGYLENKKFHATPSTKEFLKKSWDQQTWLEASYETNYPDAVVAVAKSLSWNSKYQADERSEDGDIQLSAMPGWNFRIENIKGADHGSLAHSSMRATFLIAGPGIKKGVEEKPHRMLEVAPTLLQLIGYDQPTDCEASPMDTIYA